MISVGLVDDHPTYLVGLKTALSGLPGVVVPWSTTNVAEAMKNLRDTPVNIVVMDIQYGRTMAGLDAIRSITKTWHAVAVVAMSALADPAVVQRAIDAGAVGFLSKHLPVQDMLRELEAVIRTGRGQGIPSNRSVRSDSSSRPELSRRELEVLEGIRKGRTNREIASNLGISTTTVNKHVKSVLRKLDARNRAHAASLA